MNQNRPAIGLKTIAVLAILAVALIGAAAIASFTISSATSPSIGARPMNTITGTVQTVSVTTSVNVVQTGSVTTSFNTSPYQVNTSAPDTGQIQVVSVTGPLAPFNPGGPVVSVTLENTGNESIVSLNATLDITAQTNEAAQSPYWFLFNVSSASPLQPGQSTQLSETLIGAGFQTGASYPVTIYGMTASGAEFSYTVQAQIESPAS